MSLTFRRATACSVAALSLAFCALPLTAQAPAAKTKADQKAEKAAEQPIGGTYEPNVPIESNNYPLTAESKPMPNVPHGKTFKFDLSTSTIFPGTVQTITVYIPAEYTPSKPACLWVGLDNLPGSEINTFDNLIAKKELPVIIGIGLQPGKVPSALGEENSRLQRSYEFDALSDRLARFIMEEVIPAVEAHQTPSGDAIHISRNPNDHGIGGGSTGGIGAFTAAFERPDYFRRVYTVIGTFVGMRGGEQEYVQVRKTEPKPIRVFMNDGAHDEWPGGPEMGDWHMSNLTMERALEFAGYDVKHVWGDGTHNGAQGQQIFPDVQRWLWRDYPAPIAAQAPGNQKLADILVPGENWQLSATSIPTLGAGTSLGADGTLYKVQSRGGFNAISAGGANTATVANDLHLSGLAVRSNGDVYATAQAASGDGELWLIHPDGTKVKLDDHIRGASSVAVTPDGLWLLVAQSQGQHALDYRLKPDGTVDMREAMYQFYVPLTADDDGTGQIGFDKQGSLYAATRLGVQVFDRNGRVTGILPVPGNEAIVGLTFGDADFKTLFVSTASGKVYKRKLKFNGVPSAVAPMKLPPPSAGKLFFPALSNAKVDGSANA